MDYLGKGIKYPLELSNGSVEYQSGLDLIQQSILVILSTPKGSKFFLPEYGSRLKELIFEPNDAVLEDLLSHFIYEALNKWEKRIEFLDVSFTTEETVVYCAIRYKVLKNNDIDSFVYPFYRNLKY